MHCPEHLRPMGIPLNYPWCTADCEDHNGDDDGVEDRIEEGYTVVTQEEFDAYLLAIDGEYQNWVTNVVPQIAINNLITNVLNPAIVQGLLMIEEFTAENIGMGITQAGKTDDLLTACQWVFYCLQAGSLYSAITAARAIPPEVKDPVFLTDARLLIMVNKLEVYLGLPISETL
jgi:hypothetical protein